VSGNGAPPRKGRGESLPDAIAPWEVSVRDAPESWDPARLYRMGMVVDRGSGMLRALRPVVTMDEVPPLMEDAMRGTPGQFGAARPSRLLVDSQDIADALETLFASDPTVVELCEQLPMIDAVLEEMDKRPQALSRGPLTGTAHLESELVEAAASFAEKEPWRFLHGEQPFSIAFDEEALPRLASLLGATGQVEGLALYRNEAAYREGLGQSFEEDLEVVSLLFHRAHELEAHVRAAYHRRGWRIVHGLYPHFAEVAGGERKEGIETEDSAHALLCALEALSEYLPHRLDQLLDRKERAPVKVRARDRELTIAPAHDLWLEADRAEEAQSEDEPLLEEEAGPEPLLECETQIMFGLLEIAGEPAPSIVVCAPRKELKPIDLEQFDGAGVIEGDLDGDNYDLLVLYEGETPVASLTGWGDGSQEREVWDQLNMIVSRLGGEVLVVLVAADRGKLPKRITKERVVAKKWVALRG
jgi:hypothetical protein